MKTNRYTRFASCMFTAIIIFSSNLVSSQTYSGGNGTIGDPYQIATPQDLANVINNLNAYFIQVADIDLDVDPFNAGYGFIPIGYSDAQKFGGSYNGQNYLIKNLFMNRPNEDYVGLFRFTNSSAQLDNIGIVNANILGKNFVGAITGRNEGKINTSYSTGQVKGNAYVGGIAGGHNSSGTTMTNCYSLAYVTAISTTGRAGGLAGEAYNSAITNCYATGGVNAVVNAGSLVGYNWNTVVSNCFWNTETSAQLTSSSGTGLSIAEMKTSTPFVAAGWNFAGIWAINENNSYPYLQGNQQTPLPGPNPFFVSTIQDLNNVRNMLHGHYVLLNNLDFNNDNSYAHTGDWEALKTSLTTGPGYDPTGTVGDKFKGFFDGNGHIISNLYINRPTTGNSGLFGYIGAAGEIRNLGVENANITGSATVAIVAGYNTGLIQRCYATGKVVAVQYIGGIAGYNYGLGSENRGIINDCYSLTYITATGGTPRAGGLVGENNNGILNNCYASGGVWAYSNSGGLLGYGTSSVVNNSFWNVETCAQTTSVGGTGKTIVQMQTGTTFIDAGWDFTNVWAINEGNSYPYLKNVIPGTLPNPNPIPVNSIQDLNNIRQFPHAQYILMTDLDFCDNASYAQTEGWEALKTSLTSGEGFLPIGTQTVPFPGYFDGNGHCIKNLFINRPSTGYIGLFGYLNGAGFITKLGLSNANVTGGNHTAILAGYNQGNISQCYSDGFVTGNSYVGGLVAINNGQTANTKGWLSDSYSLAYVKAISYAGGLSAQANYSTIANCYSSGSVSCNSNAGALIGSVTTSGITGCIWNNETSAQLSSAAGTGKTIPEMQTEATFAGQGWDFSNVWTITEGQSYPALINNPQSPAPGPRPFLINSIQDLHNIRNLSYVHYRLNKDLDFNSNSSYAQTPGWEAFKTSVTTGVGFEPIGTSVSPFTGLLEGNNHKIINLYINRPNTDYVGLIGYTGGAGTVSYLGLAGVNVKGKEHVAGLAGANYGTVKYCYVEGLVNGISKVGGINGLCNGQGSGYRGILSNCYSLAYVGGNSYVGGLVGNFWYSTATHCYAAGGVGGNTDSGPLFGGFSYASQYNCFWNIETCAQLLSSVGSGKTIAEMKTGATYTDWDFTNIWGISEGNSYPYLKNNVSSPLPAPRPYSVTTIQDLNNIRNLLYGHYVLNSNLDFQDNASYAQTSGWETLKTAMTEGVGFEPLGNNASRFTGLFEGQGKIIKNLYINRPTTDNIGLFGVVGGAGKIRYVGLEQVSVTGKDYVGAMAGLNYGSILYAYSTGNCFANTRAGGLTGSTNGQGTSATGYLTSCYAIVNVNSTNYTGGLSGHLWHGTVNDCYAAGSVSGASNKGGLMGTEGYSSIYNSFWDVETTGQNTSYGGTGKTTEQMMLMSTFTSAGWNFSTTWNINETQSYPWLRQVVPSSPPIPNPIEIYSIQGLNNIRNKLGRYYKLMKNLDFQNSDDYDKDPGWEAFMQQMNTGVGFQPIGDNTNRFAGFFDGNGKIIKNLYINRPQTSYVGLFGAYKSASSIRNIGLVEVNITGNEFVGALVGRAEGKIQTSFSTGAVQGTNSVGGLLGYLYGQDSNTPGWINNCYSLAIVSGATYVGGLTGSGWFATAVNCYAAGPVLGNQYEGGLFGTEGYSTFNSCYWNQETSGQDYSAGGGVALPLWRMTLKSTFMSAGWDFINVWDINDLETYPWLKVCPQNPAPAPVPNEITTIQQLNTIRNNLCGHYKLIADLDFNNDDSYSHETGWEDFKTSVTTGQGFAPIGNIGAPFRGLFDGNGHSISNLFIQRPDSDNIGLVGVYTGASNIKNLGLLNVNIAGKNNVGGFAGRNQAVISACYVSGVVLGVEDVGGITGRNDGYSSYVGDINNCYSFASISASNTRAGGIAGNNSNGSMSDSYAAGLVNSPGSRGGLAGSASNALVINCYWNTETTNQAGSPGGGFPRTTADMSYPYTANTFNNFNFVNLWAKDVAYSVNSGYPFLGFPAAYPAPHLIVPSDDATCHETAQTATLAGGGTAVIVRAGGSMEVVAANNIVMRDGTTIQINAYFHAFISGAGNYCSKSSSLVSSENVTKDSEPAPENLPDGMIIFPNPTAGIVNIILLRSENRPVALQLINMVGKILVNTELQHSTHYEMDLSGQQPGIYFVRILSEEKVLTGKVLKQ